VEGEGPGIHPLKAAVTNSDGPTSGGETAQAKPLLEPPKQIETVTYDNLYEEDLSN